MTTGRVLSLHRWPVKSMGGEEVDALRIDPRGAAGDRTHAVHELRQGRWRTLTAREAPRLLAWRASYAEADPAPDAPPRPSLRAPDGHERAWEDPDLAGALGADLGRTVRPVRDVAGQQDLHDSLLVTTSASHAALEAELGRAIDLRRWRTNLHLELDAEAFAEEGWEGAELHVGDARLLLLHPCERCAIPTRDPDSQVKDPDLLRHLARHHAVRFGINARPLGEARIAVGDRVRLVRPEARPLP